jgi:hypothetical protein
MAFKWSDSRVFCLDRYQNGLCPAHLLLLFYSVLHSYLPPRAGAACMKHVFIFTHNTIQQNSTPFFTGYSVYLSYRHTKKYKNLTWLSLLWRKCGSRASHHSTSLSSQFVPSSVCRNSPIRYWSLYNLSAFCTPTLIDFVFLHASSQKITIHRVRLISDSRSILLPCPALPCRTQYDYRGYCHSRCDAGELKRP